MKQWNREALEGLGQPISEWQLQTLAVTYAVNETFFPEDGLDLLLGITGSKLFIDYVKKAGGSEKAIDRLQKIENNFYAEGMGFGRAAVRDFQPGTVHRAENINAGQVTDRDGLVRVDKIYDRDGVLKIDDPKKLNDQQIKDAQIANGKPESVAYYPTGYPAWKEGTMVTDRIVTKPEKMRMVIDEGQYKKLMKPDAGKQPQQALGGWATKDPVNSVADMRNKLAVTEDFKATKLDDGTSNKFYVVEFEVQPGVGIREGTAGSMYDAKTKIDLPGGAQQMNFVEKSPYTNPELYKLGKITEIK